MKKTPILLAAVLLLAASSASRATDLIYTVVINTSSLTSDPNFPFSLDLDLSTGSNNGTSGNVSNTVTLSKFSFVGGSIATSPNFTQGSESGSLLTSLVLTNSSLNNEYAIQFTTIPSQVVFTVDETTNSETAPSGLANNDQFSVFIDNNTTAGFVPTNDPSGGDQLIASTIFSGATSNSVGTFHSVAPEAGVTAVPEPASAGLLLIGAAGLIARRRRVTAPQAA